MRSASRHLAARRLASAALATTTLVASGLVAAACSGDDGPDASRFCGEIDANREALFAPNLTTSAEITPLIELYRSVGTFAPLAIEDEWTQIVRNYETAATVVPGDAASMQIAAAEAYQTEESAASVKQWLIDNCAVDIGPIATIVPHDG